MTPNRITSLSPAGITGATALNRALANPKVATLAKALDIDLANEEKLAPVLAKAMAILDRAGVGEAGGSGESSGSDAANPLLAASALMAVPSLAYNLPASQVRAALRAYRVVAAL